MIELCCVYGSFYYIFVSCHVLVLERIYTKQLPEFPETPCSKQTEYLKLKFLQQDSNPQPFSSQTNTQAFSQTSQMIELCCEYLFMPCIRLYLLLLYHIWVATLYSCLNIKKLLGSNPVTVTYFQPTLTVLLSFQSLEFSPVRHRIIWRPFYQFALQFCQKVFVWLEIYLEVFLKQAGFFISVLILMLLFSYVNGSFNFNMLQLLKDLKHNLRQTPQCLLLPHYVFIYLRNKKRNKANIFLVAFIWLYLVTGTCSPRCKFSKLKACNRVNFFTLDYICFHHQLVSFYLNLLCNLCTISKFKRINNFR